MRVFICPVCGLPFAQITSESIVIRARHHGRMHACAIYVSEDVIEELLEQTEELEQRRWPHLKDAEAGSRRNADT